VEELQREAIEFRLDLAAHRVHGLLRDVRHQVLHYVLKRVRDDVERDHPEEDAPDIREIDSGAWDAPRLRDEALENLRRRLAEDLRTEDAEERADRAGDDHHREGGAVRMQVADKPRERALEVLRLLRRHAEARE